MNEETIIEKRLNGQNEKKNEGAAWKYVTLGGISGILMGAGLMYGGQAAAKAMDTPEDTSDVPAPEEENPAVEAPEMGETSHTLENGLQVAAVDEDLSFGEAFAQARAEVGPGGVFHWHGGIYNTYTASEWSNMTTAQKHDFAQQVQPEIHPDELSTPTDGHTEVVVVHHVYHHHDTPVADDVHLADSSDDVQIVGQQADQDFDTDADVHIVGYADVDGHLAVGLDITGDSQVDVAIIDVDDDLALSGPDLVVDGEGNMATINELVNPVNPYQQVMMENPDTTPDMPDSMNDLIMTDV